MVRFVFLAVAVATFAVAGCRPASTARAAVPAPVAVRATVVHGSPVRPLVVRGRAEAASTRRLGFRSGGVIASVLVAEGERVHAGQILARLDAGHLRARARAATTAFEQAERSARRTTALASAGALGSAVREDADSALELAQANAALVRDDLRHSVLVAPVDAIVEERVAEPGETVAPGAPVLVVDEVGSVVVRVGVAEREVARVSVGERVRIDVDESGASVEGTVLAVTSSPRPDDGLYDVRIAPAQADVSLRPGALVTVTFASPSEARERRVPLLAVVHRRDENFVFVIAAGSPARVRRRPVRAGAPVGEDVAVEGLRDGERIVAEGAFFLEDGQAVSVLP